jgi:hypothetical protein
MDQRNTLAAAYAAGLMKRKRVTGGEGREEARAEAGRAVCVSPMGHGRLDEATLLDVLRGSAGPCDRTFASRIAGCLGPERVL